MAVSTEYYSLVKPSGTDLVDIDVLNGNFDKIDQVMKTNADAIAGKQDILTIDESPTENSVNPASSGGIFNALESMNASMRDGLSRKIDKSSISEKVTENSSDPISSGAVYEALSEVQESLVFDDEPLDGSGNPVKSGGIKAALDGKQDFLSYVPETDEVKVSDYIFLERGGTILKCLAEKILLFSDLLVTESGDALLTEDGEVLLFDGNS